jgi:hypothetical protein
MSVIRHMLAGSVNISSLETNITCRIAGQEDVWSRSQKGYCDGVEKATPQRLLLYFRH